MTFPSSFRLILAAIRPWLTATLDRSPSIEDDIPTKLTMG